MRRKIVLLLLVAVVLIVASCNLNINERYGNDAEPSITEHPLAEKTDYFNKILETNDYTKIKLELSNATEQDKTLFESMATEYINNLCSAIIEKAKNSEVEYQDARDMIQEISLIEIDLAIINASIEILDQLEQSNSNYVTAVTALDQFDLVLAQENFEKIIGIDVNYKSAQDYIEYITNYNTTFSSLDKDYIARTPYDYPCKDGYVYFPHSVDNIHSIVRYNIDTDDIIVLPIADSNENFIISGINIVGDFIFFIAGEDIGKGRAFEYPYNIYMMNLDGTGFRLLEYGNYKDLYYHNQSFYASTNDDRLLQYDIYFNEFQLIHESDVKEIYPRGDELFYVETVPSSFVDNSSLIKYENGEKTIINSQYNLSTRVLEDEIFYCKYRVYFQNRIYSTTLEGEEIMFGKFREIKEITAQIDESFIVETIGDFSQKQYVMYTPEINLLEDITGPQEYIDFQIVGSCTQKDALFIKKNNILYINQDITNISSIKEIPFPTDTSAYQLNHSFQDYKMDYFSDETIIIEEDDFFAYIDDELCIYIDRIYDVPSKSHIHLAHVISKDPTVLDIGYYDESPGLTNAFADVIARENSAVFAINGDFWHSSTNDSTGIVIRDGVVYKDELIRDMVALLPEGGFKCYEVESNPITLEQLQANGVMDTLSFGPVLVSDGQYGQLLDTHRLRNKNPRTAMGMINPNHYLFAITDGRCNNSYGMAMYELAEYMERNGCIEAYNLDGGQSIGVVFMGNFLNSHTEDWNGSFHRAMKEIIFIGQSDIVPEN